ncbi:PadR family transcriptional regulator [Paenibacillus sediminis]|uniref:DNA-binding PadR family transcriptional regulator n=1 Tax=Paenibacillus sediminis TaxID=664909 RepID=A0ABS4H935_9BACL|nr:PadR family transcriptional regulator [Paenibacillus sediminis]MBP1938560.1 DNA-binding PadR family transcriptional regulator [Paenibacillus sediminis]
MNSLGYTLLGMIARKPSSGYELKRNLEGFWHVEYSQIYPLLSKMEQEGLTTYELEEQSGNKPDKKIYSITSKGLTLLKEWLPKPPAPPVQRDEFLAKVNTMWLTEPYTMKLLFEERIAAFKKQVAHHKEELRVMEEQFGDGVQDLSSIYFGRYMLYHQRLRHDQEEIAWCEWVLSIVNKQLSSK